MDQDFSLVTFYTFYILEGNYLEFKVAVEKYIEAAMSDEYYNDSGKLIDLHIRGGREISRRIHNYTASAMSLVEHSRRAERKLKEHPLECMRLFSDEYRARLDKHLKDTFENKFVGDLRRYVQHRKTPVPTLHSKLTRVDGTVSEAGGVFCQEMSFQFSAQDIKDFDWSPKSRKYIEDNRLIPIVEIIDTHFTKVKNFYLWIEFREKQLNPYTPSQIKEMTFEQWKQMTNTDFTMKVAYDL